MIACGGTGGHLFPGLAVAETLLRRGHPVRLLVSEKTIDQTVLMGFRQGLNSSSLSVSSISAVGYGSSRQLMSFCIRLARATKASHDECGRFEPDVVLGMGGFTSGPAVLAARLRGIPTVIHESNAVPGKANRWAGKFVDRVAVGWAECARYFGRTPVTVTGTPIRTALCGGKVADAVERLGLERGRLVVAVMGGSQGAHGINEAVMAALPRLKDSLRHRVSGVQFAHLTGAQDEKPARAAYEKNGLKANVMGFCNEMELVYSAADVVVARAGAATLTEIAAFGLPAVLVPYPQAANNHQWHNARVFERAGAAQIVEQNDAAGGSATFCERIADALTTLLSDPATAGRMAAASKSLAITDAAERITALLEKYKSPGVHRNE
jgi:UDP-N-acetylglucosamine--N-acetylmuramyl-(pentapeptide) pyrophosphoryl-undecaprenol N-acetylglucosamine transferase